MTQPQAEFLDLYKAGLKTAADLMKSTLQSAEKLQNQQLVAIRTALDQQSKSINELGQARSVDELLALQTKMAGAQWERAVGFWNEVYQAQIAQAQTWFNETTAAASQATNVGLRQAQQQVQQHQPQQRQEQHRKSA